MAKLMGFTIFIFDVIFGLYWAARGKPHNEQVKAMCFAIGILAIILIIFSSFTEAEINTPLVTLKGTVEKIKIDAKQIEEFRKRIEDQSVTVDLVAKQASDTKKLYEDLLRKNDIADKKLKNIEDVLREAAKASSDLQSIVDFTMITVAAQNDDRTAFDKLVEIAQKENNKFSGFAVQIIEKILVDINPLIQIRIYPPAPWEKMGIDPKTISSDDFVEAYRKSIATYRPSIISNLWSRKDISKREKIKFLVDVLKTDSSLSAVEYACRLINMEAHLDKNILGINLYLDWWEKNKDSIKD